MYASMRPLKPYFLKLYLVYTIPLYHIWFLVDTLQFSVVTETAATTMLPQETIILPFPKVNKDPTDLNSYRLLPAASEIFSKDSRLKDSRLLGRKQYIKARTFGLQGGSQY